MHQTRKNIVAISGSLKSTSSNTSILYSISEFADEDINFCIYDQLESIPPFNPEKENDFKEVQYLRHLLKEADGVIISTPEYAFGVPGILKNALDWLVSSGELNEKPVIAISASPMYLGGDKALGSLLLTLGALGTKMDTNSSMSIPNIQNKITAGKVTDKQTLDDLKVIFSHLLKQMVIKTKQS